jgi:hypothetical protein
MYALFALLACAPDPSLSPAPPPPGGWTIAVWMDGDNDLEALVPWDLNELERAAAVAGPDVQIVVQADRIPGYVTWDGDWTGTRRYVIAGDDTQAIASPVVADLGERDMGDPAELSEFLLWADTTAPAEHLAVVLWNHGGGLWIASDDTSGSMMHLAGELQAGLQPVVDARGRRIDLVAFDACNMGQWEVAHALAPQADVMVASEAWVNNQGLGYDLAFAGLDGGVDARTLGDRLAQSAAQRRELTMSALDLAQEAEVAAAVDALAQTWLDAPALLPEWARVRRETLELDRQYPDWWLDLGDLGAAAGRSADPALAAAGQQVADAVDAATIARYGRIQRARGLSIFGLTRSRYYGALYSRGDWAQDTAWDELLTTLGRARP